MNLLQDLLEKKQKDMLRSIKEMAKQTFRMIEEVMLKSSPRFTEITYFF